MFLLGDYFLLLILHVPMYCREFNIEKGKSCTLPIIYLITYKGGNGWLYFYMYLSSDMGFNKMQESTKAPS